MAKLGGWVVTVALVVASGLGFAACGNHARTTAHDAAVTPGDAAATPGDAAVWPGDAIADLTLSDDAPSCSELPCLAHANAIIAACRPRGTCIEQSTTTQGTSVTTKCFENGVTISLTSAMPAADRANQLMAVKKDGAACYSFSEELQSAEVLAAVYRDGAGVELIRQSGFAPTLNVTCPGDPTILPDSSCTNPLYALGRYEPFTNTTCTTGTCTF